MKHVKSTNLHNESITQKFEEITCPLTHTPQNKEYLATTIGLYVLGKISLGKAAERIGVTRWKMGEIFQGADVELRLGPQTQDDLDDKIDAALDGE